MSDYCFLGNNILKTNIEIDKDDYIGDYLRNPIVMFGKHFTPIGKVFRIEINLPKYVTLFIELDEDMYKLLKEVHCKLDTIVYYNELILNNGNKLNSLNYISLHI